MKHSDFLRSLKTLKSRLLKEKNKSDTLTHYSPDLKHDTHCHCKDSNGENKYLYTSYEDLEYLLARKDITLHAFPCPYEKGWHLTKN